jgi:benzoate/toluate 1,2-dioxygenase alpha subunit
MRYAEAARYVIDDPAQGLFRVHRDVFSDAELFEMEMRHIFEGGWVYLCLENQVPNPNDFLMTRIGRRSVIVSRDEDGVLHCFYNTCRHRGAKVCHVERGNRKYHVCDYHGWAYDSSGRNFDIKDRKAGKYGECFEQEDHDLISVARFDSYAGLLFASANPDVPSLSDYLGDAKIFLDLVMDQGRDGMELVPGRTNYTYAGNWKLQLDNSLDFYHLTSTHRTFVNIVNQREAGKSRNQQVTSPNFQRRFAMPAGMFNLGNGHAVMWADQPNPETQPLWGEIDEVTQRVGEMRAKWMLRARNLTIFPNLQLADSTSLVLRTINPLAVDKTEMVMYSLAPVGEADDLRYKRIRQHEDFFNVSGLATPDDTIVYEDCQVGFESCGDDWLQCFERGIMSLNPGANEHAEELGIHPVASMVGEYATQNEVSYHSAYREWVKRLSGAMPLAAE